MKLSIIIPVYNKLNLTLSCLKDLTKLPSDICEIIVVDDGSTDNTENILKTRKDIKYVRKENNSGFGKTVSVGFKHASGDIVMILNNDIRVSKNHKIWVNDILDWLENNDRYLVGPTGGLIDPNTFEFVYETQNENKKINYMSGWCLCAKRYIWDELAHDEDNIFDPDFYMYYEDTSLSFKATKLGIGFKIIPIPLVHFGKLSSEKKQIPHLYNSSKQLFRKKWSNTQ